MLQAMQGEDNPTAWENWQSSNPPKENQEDLYVVGGLGHSPCLLMTRAKSCKNISGWVMQTGGNPWTAGFERAGQGAACGLHS